MGQRLKKFLDGLDPVVHLFFLLAIICLASGFYYLWKRPAQVQIQEKTQVQSNNQEKTHILTVDEVNSLISKAIATISAVPKTVVQKVTQKETQLTYIPLGDTSTTTSRDWVTLPDTEISIDLINDYGSRAQVSWEASLKVIYGNGGAFARLWDDTHKIAVDGSEISTSANSDYIHQSTKDLNLWSGRNIYKVQIKSLTGYEVTYTNGRIKINY